MPAFHVPESGPASQTRDMSDFDNPSWRRNGVPYAISTDPKPCDRKNMKEISPD